jgi:hypothetical protein
MHNQRVNACIKINQSGRPQKKKFYESNKKFISSSKKKIHKAGRPQNSAARARRYDE